MKNNYLFFLICALFYTKDSICSHNNKNIDTIEITSIKHRIRTKSDPIAINYSTIQTEQKMSGSVNYKNYTNTLLLKQFNDINNEKIYTTKTNKVDDIIDEIEKNKNTEDNENSLMFNMSDDENSQN